MFLRFEMNLRQSDELLYGMLSAIDNSDPLNLVTVDRWRATSGQRTHQTIDNVWTKGKGPLPPSCDIAPVTYRVLSSLAHTSIGECFLIRPDWVVKQNGKLVERSLFRIHFDGGPPGSAGCPVLNEYDWRSFKAFMAVQPAGYITLEVVYKSA